MNQPKVLVAYYCYYQCLCKQFG